MLLGFTLLSNTRPRLKTLILEKKCQIVVNTTFLDYLRELINKI
jgi:hypothetical protein